jgi:two-component system, chemotaxis family, protein-glutamate methylesterase/glutaminase
MNLRVLIADDSVLFRHAIAMALESLPDVTVVGSVSNGKLALKRISELHPDLLTLDMEMPGMDGLGVLDALRQSGETVAVIIVSALTRQGGKLTIRALQKGAFDFITKPDSPDAQQGLESLRKDLAPRIRSLAHRLEIRNILGKGPIAHSNADAMGSAPACRKTLAGKSGESSIIADRFPGIIKPQMVLIGVSTGGPEALARLLPGIPGDIGVPLLIVQHMPPIFTQSLAESLSARCALRVVEASHGDIIAPNAVYIAPGGKHMRLDAGPNRSKIIHINDDPPENNCKPSVDYLFRSAAAGFPGQSVAVILTGMGSDGTLGLRLLKRHGCYVIAQNEATCVVYGMPKSAVDAQVADDVLPLEDIAARITAVTRG